MLLSRPRRADERRHGVRVALAPGVPAEYHDAFTRRFGIAIVDGYGSTETNFVIGDLPGEQRPGTMGRLRPGFDVAVVDAEDNRAARRRSRANWSCGRSSRSAFATGYFAMADKTVEAWRNLWFHTGDRVVRESRRPVPLPRPDEGRDPSARREHLLLRGRAGAAGHPAVAQAAVVPVRSELAEDEVMAAIVLRPGAALAPVELLDYCSPRLPYFAVPRYLDFVAALPTTESGKVRKFRLRERGVTAATFDALAERLQGRALMPRGAPALRRRRL